MWTTSCRPTSLKLLLVVSHHPFPPLGSICAKALFCLDVGVEQQMLLARKLCFRTYTLLRDTERGEPPENVAPGRSGVHEVVHVKIVCRNVGGGKHCTGVKTRVDIEPHPRIFFLSLRYTSSTRGGEGDQPAPRLGELNTIPSTALLQHSIRA